MAKHTLAELVDFVHRSESGDETGDATLQSFLEEEALKHYADDDAYDGWKFSAILEAYLVWACGLRWEEFLNNPDKFGGAPPGIRTTIK